MLSKNAFTQVWTPSATRRQREDEIRKHHNPYKPIKPPKIITIYLEVFIETGVEKFTGYNEYPDGTTAFFLITTIPDFTTSISFS